MNEPLEGPLSVGRVSYKGSSFDPTLMQTLGIKLGQLVGSHSRRFCHVLLDGMWGKNLGISGFPLILSQDPCLTDPDFESSLCR